MYPGSLRCTSSVPPAQAFVPTPYPEYVDYHYPAPRMEHHGQLPGEWGAHYGPMREEWCAYGPGTNSTVSTPLSGLSPGQVPYSPQHDYGSLHPSEADMLQATDGIHIVQVSPEAGKNNPYQWMGKTAQSTSVGKTRTKEKYRVVYTDHQRLELEKEFHYNRYITITRKAQLAANLRLSERQIKIWFQNRRAKERKIFKKKMIQYGGLDSVQGDLASASPLPIADSMTHNGMTNSLYPPPAMNGLQHNGSLQQVTVSP
ncbi:homeobox protein CDX-1-like [Ambystoma mexicanum]|uniref:homeobox protein CDX-1-like n=1 Tax=Ambystoma mexicanum TaxID=8296 RepID=UPI0037E7500B